MTHPDTSSLHRALAMRPAEEILKGLANSYSQNHLSTRPLSWHELQKHLPSGISHGTIFKTIAKLAENQLIRKRKNGKYEITFEGRWALLKGTRPRPTLDSSVKRLMELHGYVDFTPTQLKFLKEDKILRSRRNVCIFAYPDQGKTLMAELFMNKVLRRGERAIYLTPYKALNREKYELFSEIFSLGLGISVRRVDGDTPTRLTALESARLVVATYERAELDLILRRKWILNRKLIIADEITLLQDEGRGPDIDMFLTDLSAMPRKRIITLSSRIGNEKALADWLQAVPFTSPHRGPRQEFIVNRTDNAAVFEEVRGPDRETIPLDGSLWIHAVAKHLKARDPRQLLVLSGTRIEAENIANQLATLPGGPTTKSATTEVGFLEQSRLTRSVGNLMRRGTSFHHAGIPHHLRKSIEDAVRQKALDSLSATTTLSHGINLPFGVVVLNLDSFRQLKRIEYEQYIGRARASAVGNSVFIYVVTSDPLNAKLRIFAGGLEDVKPGALSSGLIEKSILSLARNGPVKETSMIADIQLSLRRTLAFACLESKPALGVVIEKMIAKMIQLGLISKRKSLIRVNNRGRILAELGLRIKEENFIRKELGTTKNWADPVLELLRVASSVGMANEFDYVRDPEDKAKLLSEWIEETPLDRIVSRYGNSLRDADVPKLSRDTTETLFAVFRIAQDLRINQLASLCRNLTYRLKHGIKSDLAETDLFSLSNMTRPLARKLYNNGFKSTFEVYESEPSHIAQQLGIRGNHAKRVWEEVWSMRNDSKWMRTYKRWRRAKRRRQSTSLKTN